MTYKLTSSARRLIVFENEKRLYTIDLEASVVKIIPDKDELAVLLVNMKKLVFDKNTGVKLLESAHGGVKTEKQRRKEIYISKRENERKQNGR